MNLEKVREKDEKKERKRTRKRERENETMEELKIRDYGIPERKKERETEIY